MSDAKLNLDPGAEIVITVYPPQHLAFEPEGPDERPERIRAVVVERLGHRPPKQEEER